MRLGSLVPARLAQEALGQGQASFYAWPVACGVLLVVATYALGRLLGGRPAAVLAAGAVAACPVLVDTDDYLTSWLLLPDVPSAAFLTLAFALLVAGARRARGQAGWRPGPGAALLAASGLALGWAYLCKEYAVFAFPAFLAAGVLQRLPWRRWAYVATPAAACLALELANGAYVYGSPLARLTEASAHGQELPEASTRSDAWLGLWHALTGWTGPGATVPAAAYGALVVAAAGLAVAGLLVGPLLGRGRDLAVPALWVGCFWLCLTLMGGVLQPDTPSLRLYFARYWIPLLPAAAVGAAAALTLGAGALLRWVPRPAVRAGIVGALAVAALVAYAAPTVTAARDTRPEEPTWDRLRGFLVDVRSRGVIIDQRLARTLDYYRYEPVGGDVVWDGRIDPLPEPWDQTETPRPRTAHEWVVAADHPADDVLVVDDRYGPTGLRPRPGPDGVEQPYATLPRDTDGWVEAWSEGTLRVYVAEGSAAAARAAR
nr:glycosyltransferase family 39 protein [Motilibacter aurantiacus]